VVAGIFAEIRRRARAIPSDGTRFRPMSRTMVPKRFFFASYLFTVMDPKCFASSGPGPDGARWDRDGGPFPQYACSRAGVPFELEGNPRSGLVLPKGAMADRVPVMARGRYRREISPNDIRSPKPPRRNRPWCCQSNAPVQMSM